MSKRKNLYVGAAGQAAVMSEFLLLGYNVAVPEVDVGDDLFVVNDAGGNFRRVQVKTATAKPTRRGYTAQFLIPVRQLEQPHTPELYYVFAVRGESRWADFLIVERKELFEIHSVHQVGSLIGVADKQQVRLAISFRDADVTCGGQSFQAMRNQFGKFKV